MRTPPGLSVASERPWMTMPPCSVHSAKSPWCHTPGKRSKYAARYLRPSGSFQNMIGMDGKGRVHTNSPFRPGGRLRPVSSHTSTAMPSPGPWISPRHTGLIGMPSTKHDTMSVPPEMGIPPGLGIVEQDGPRGVEGRAVIEKQRRLGGQRRDEPVPHHPAAGGE